MAYELVGADDELLSEIVSGMGNTELVGEIGAVGRPRSKGAPQLAVKKDALRLARRMAIGFGPTTIAAGGNAILSQTPQVVFRPERMFIPSDVAFDLSVTDVKIGQRSQLVAAGALPGAIFSEVSVDVFTHWDTAEVGNTITISLNNVNPDDPVAATAALLGAAALR
jgi:hypothetical protein